MKKTLIIIAVVVAVFIGAYISMSNNLVALKNNVDLQYSNIEAVLQKRMDKVTSLVKVVSENEKFSKEIIKEITDARKNLGSSIDSGDIDDVQSDLNTFNATTSKFIALAESYPEINTDASFTRLMDEIAETENELTVARQNYNGSVNVFNVKIGQFPYSIVSSFKGYTARKLFKADNAAQTAPEIDFGN